VVGPGEFNISYVDGSGAAGDYFTDMFGIGGSTVKGLEMGLSIGGQIGQGIMGIGYNTSEANVETGNQTVYSNLPNQLVDEGLINSLAYSLWLNDLGRYHLSLLDIERLMFAQILALGQFFSEALIPTNSQAISSQSTSTPVAVRNRLFLSLWHSLPYQPPADPVPINSPHQTSLLQPS